MKHTKGPWIFKEWEKEGIDFYHIRSEQKFTDLIATIHRWKGYLDKRECLANAKLIAAAPEMFEALESVNKYFIDLQNKCALTAPDERAWKLVSELLNELK